MKILIYPAYFPNIWTYACILQSSEIVFENHGNYQKQTFRNRAQICGANGPLNLTVPVSFSHKHRQLYREVEISNIDNWQSNHWKSIVSAYNSSPYFEFYRDLMEPFFNRSFKYIQDLNLESIKLLNSLLNIEKEWQFSSSYDTSTSAIDFRHLIQSRRLKFPPLDYPYIQVFSAKHGFINNLSSLDLIMNEGPASVDYLLNQNIDLLIR